MPTLTWSDLEPRFRALVERPTTASEVPALLADLDALEREVRERYAALERAKDEDTADQQAKQAFLDFVQDVMPQLEPIEDRLNRKLLEVHGYRPPQELEVAWADMRDTVDLYREENVPLNVEEQRLQQRYGEITGRTRVVLNGEETTVARAQAQLELPDRAAREVAWRAIEESKAAHRSELDELYPEMVRLRGRIAGNASLPDYRAYAWKARHRREYSAEDAVEMHAAVEAEVVPRLRAQHERRRASLGVERLRPWDLSTDPRGREPLRPFAGVSELDTGLSRMFQALDPELGEAYELLQDGWMDLEPRPNKVPGLGYQSYFPLSRRPYIYWSAVGTDDDLLVMRHEAGHAFHSVLTERAWPLLRQRSVRPELNELASQAMELLTLPLLEREHGGFYARVDADRSRVRLLERVGRLLVHSCRVDAIQHWVYQQPAERLTAEQIDAAWTTICERLDDGVDWGGLEPLRAKGWQILHLFQVPLYYLEYAIAYLGALQLWARMEEDPAAALAGYKRALRLGGTRPLGEAYAAAGAEFRFDRELIAQLADRWERAVSGAWEGSAG